MTRIRSTRLGDDFGPASWPQRPLGETCRLLPSKSICSAGDAKVRAITTACLTETGFDPAGIKSARMWSSDAVDCVVKAGEILIARSNTPELVGRVAMFKGEAPGAVASDLTIRIWPSGEVHGEFLVQYLSALYLSGYWRERAGGASGSMKKITRSQILAEPIPVPPIDEQRAVAAWLNEQLAVVAKGHRAALTGITELDLLPQKLLGEAVDVQWPVSRLGDHCKKIGSGSTPRGGHKSYHANGIPLIRSQNVLMRSFSADGLAHISADVHSEMAGTEVLPGDVLLNITGASIGRVCVAPSEILPANVNQHVCIIRCKELVHPEFLMLYLSSPAFQKHIDDTQAGGTRQALTKADIEDFMIPMIYVAEQQAISKRLSLQLQQLASARSVVQKQLAELELLPQKLLAQVFCTNPTRERGTVPRSRVGLVQEPDA